MQIALSTILGGDAGLLLGKQKVPELDVAERLHAQELDERVEVVERVVNGRARDGVPILGVE